MVSAQESQGESPSVSATIFANYGTKYFAPIGFALEDDNSVLQGAVVLVAESVFIPGDGFDAFVWGNEGFNDGPSEIDWGVGYSLPLLSGSVRVGFDHYRYPDGKLGTPENLARLTVTQSGVADVILDGFWRVTDGIKKQYFVNLTVSKSLSISANASRQISIIPRATAIYNDDLWGLTGYTGTLLGTTLEVQWGRMAAYSDLMQLFKSGDHLLGDREVKNQTVVQIGLRVTLPFANRKSGPVQH